jgi:PAS domain S-box-containing protein
MKLTIRIKLLIGFTLLLLLSLLIQAITFDITKQYISSQIATNQNAEAKRGVKEVENFFTELSLSTYGITQLYERTPPTTSNSTTIQVQTVAKYIFENNSYIKKIAILSPQGKELAIYTSKGEIPAKELNYEMTSPAFTSATHGVTDISEVYFIEHQVNPYLDMFSPIFDHKGNVIGIVKMQVSLKTLKKIIADTTIGQEGYLYIVDNKGRLIAHKPDSFMQERPTLTSRKIISDALKGVETPEAERIYTNEKNVTVIGTALPISGYNWVVIFEQPKDEAFGFLTFIRNLYIVTLIGSFIFLLVIALFLSENFTRSIRKLQKSTQAIEQGKYDEGVIINSGDEIETLSYSFSSMVNQLLQRENSLKKDKQETEVLLQSLTDGVAALDENNAIIMYNKAAERITGSNAINVFGKNIDMILHFYDDEELIPFSKYSNQKDERATKLREKGMMLLTTQNKKVFVLLTIAPVIFNDKRTGSIITMHDTSQEHELEEMKLDFVSMAAHELRTPLTAIRGYASLLQMELTKDENPVREQMVNRLVVSGENLGNLIDNLLSVNPLI